MMTRGVCSILVWCIAGTACAADLQADLKGRWKLAGDCQDSSGQGNHGTARSVVYGEGPHGAANGAAVFNGRDSMMQVPDAPSLRLGSGDFTICLWARPETPMRGVFGDLVGKFDAKRRCGVNFHLAGSSPGYNAMSDTRHVHFGIDDGYLGTWEDCGKPRASNALVTCLIVFEDQLYCGIADAAEPSQAARVFRWTGGRQWVDCGRLGSDPNHLSVQAMIVHRGKLYAGTGIYDWVRARGQIQGTPPAAKTRVFVYQGGTQWQDLGQVGEGSRVLTMASFNGELYVGLDANPGGGKCFKHNGTAWIDCGAPDGVNLQNLLPLGGVLYAATHGRVHRYEGGQRWSCIGDHPFEITQTHCLDVAGGKLHAGTWPQGYVLRHEGDQKWSNAGRLGLVPGQPECNEVNDLIVHNGKLYAGVIPKAEVYRYESDDQWTLVGSLVHRPDWARNRLDTWCRLTAFASFQGRLFACTGSCRGRTEDVAAHESLGRVYAIQAGQLVSHHRDIGGEWSHLAAVRQGRDLLLYVNGRLAARTEAPAGRSFDVSNTQPWTIGCGAQAHFAGSLADVRVYARALNAQEVAQVHATPLLGPRTLGSFDTQSRSGGTL